MKIKLTATLFIFVYTILVYGQADNYSDSLKVNVLSGVRLRYEPDVMSNTKRILNYGESVEAIDKLPNEVKIGDLYGKWVKVIVSNDTGFLFDAYLSNLPSIRTSKSDMDKGLLSMVTNYVFKNLVIVDSVHYNSCFESEGYHDMKIYELDDGHQFILNGYYEAYGIELQLKGINYNEGLCVIKNFIELSKAQEVVYKTVGDRTYIDAKSGENCCHTRIGVCDDKFIILITGGP